MKKLVILFLLVSAAVIARPAKEICRELSELDEEGLRLPCAEIDSDDVVSLKLLFNQINRELVQALNDQQEFNMGAVNARKNDSDVEIARLEAIRDNLTDATTIARVQAQIDKIAEKRDLLNKNVPNEDGSDPPQVAAGKLGPVVSALNLELNDVQRELDAQ